MNSSTTGGALPPKAVRRAVISSVVGNGLEWFDFMVYGFYTALIARLFFPSNDPLVSMMLAMATFAVSFLVRPVGGVLIGIYADRVGRKPALTMMILMMGASTLLIGLTPSYETIGIAAPIIIILARLIQGVSVGGEFASSTSMLIEYAPADRKMLYGSFQMCSQAFALMLAAGSGYLLGGLLSPPDMASWGWRIPFLLGALIAPIGFYIRRHVEESPEFARLEGGAKKTKIPFTDVLRRHPGALIGGLGMVVVGTVSNYVWFIYLTSYVVQTLQLPFANVLLSATLAGAMLFILCPIVGHLCDRYGAQRLFVLGIIAFSAMAWPLIAWLTAGPSFERLLMVQFLASFAIALIWGPTPGLFAGLFPTGVRSTGMSISYNLGVLIFGAAAPMGIIWAVRQTGDQMVAAYYIIACGLLSLGLMAWGAKLRARASAA